LVVVLIEVVVVLIEVVVLLVVVIGVVEILLDVVVVLLEVVVVLLEVVVVLLDVVVLLVVVVVDPPPGLEFNARASIFAAALSATVRMYADGFAVLVVGKILASTTNRFLVPQTWVFVSTTAFPPAVPSSVPIRQVPIQWLLP